MRDGDGWTLAEICHRNFAGGSASTPTLGQNGTRVYLGDDVRRADRDRRGGLRRSVGGAARLADLRLDRGGLGRRARSSPRRRTASSRSFDDGDHGRRGWTAALDLYDIPPDLAGYGGMNLLLAGIGANGLLIQAGAGLRTGAQSLPVRTGIAHVDRAHRRAALVRRRPRGVARRDEHRPDGALYLPHAPLRRAFSLALGLTTEPLVGGVSKWASTRDDLLARDAACAAADRAANAATLHSTCPESAIADAAQVDALRRQMLDAAARAEGGAAIDVALARRLRWLGARVGAPPVRLSITPAVRYDARIARYHRKAARGLGRACRLLTSAD